jgi:hypothetical protein
VLEEAKEKGDSSKIEVPISLMLRGVSGEDTLTEAGGRAYGER